MRSTPRRHQRPHQQLLNTERELEHFLFFLREPLTGFSSRALSLLNFQQTFRELGGGRGSPVTLFLAIPLSAAVAWCPALQDPVALSFQRSVSENSLVAMDFSGQTGRVIENPAEAQSAALEEGHAWRVSRGPSRTGPSAGGMPAQGFSRRMALWGWQGGEVLGREGGSEFSTAGLLTFLAPGHPHSPVPWVPQEGTGEEQSPLASWLMHQMAPAELLSGICGEHGARASWLDH